MAEPGRATWLAALLPGRPIALLPHFEAMAAGLDRLGDQRATTCGAYVLTYLLPAMGFAEHRGEALTEDSLAELVGVAPAGAPPEAAGASPEGVARTIAVVSGGALVTLPVPGRDERGEPLLTPVCWTALLDLVVRELDRWRPGVILNYEADQLLDATHERYTAAALGEPGAAAALPRDSWGVGHFAAAGGTWTGPGGERWLLLLNSFKRRGFEGYEPQPAELCRRGVCREDGRGGGVLLVLPRAHLHAAQAALGGIGITPRTWSNGSPPPRPVTAGSRRPASVRASGRSPGSG